MSNAHELENLTRRFGPFARMRFEHGTASAGFAEWLKKLTKRHGEVVLVVPRGKGGVLLHTKRHYPRGVYRLPTGGVRPGEDPEAAARREAYEELGFKLRGPELVSVLENIFVVNGSELRYPSYVFETPELTKRPRPKDSTELISGFLDADRSGIEAAAEALANLPGPWREWGRFRSAPHRWLAEHGWQNMRAVK
jgi:8-oxo-dGTP pyrophosphatase MutT (NUDIX family)